MGQWFKRILGGAFVWAVYRGILLWLDTSYGIRPEVWVANGMGFADHAIRAHQAIAWILSGVAGLIGLVLGPTLWEVGSRLKSRIVHPGHGKHTGRSELSHKAKLPIRLEFSEEHPFVTENFPDEMGRVWRIIAIRASNDNDGLVLDDCAVRLEYLINVNGAPSNVTPINFITQKQRMENRKGEPFKLRYGQSKYIEIASLDETEPDSPIMLHYETMTNTSITIPRAIPRAEGPYRIGVSAAANGVPSTPSEEFLLYVDDGGHLRMRSGSTSQVSRPETKEQQTRAEQIGELLDLIETWSPWGMPRNMFPMNQTPKAYTAYQELDSLSKTLFHDDNLRSELKEFLAYFEIPPMVVGGNKLIKTRFGTRSEAAAELDRARDLAKSLARQL